MPRPLGIAVDLDGTIASWDRGEGFTSGVGRWLPGAKEALLELRAGGIRIVVHTCRCTWRDGGGWMAVATFLRDGRFKPFLVTTDETQRELWTPCVYEGTYPSDPWGLGRPARGRGGGPHPLPEDDRAIGVWMGTGKPIADIYLDDRGMHFDGSWASALPLLRARLAEEAKTL